MSIGGEPSSGIDVKQREVLELLAILTDVMLRAAIPNLKSSGFVTRKFEWGNIHFVVGKKRQAANPPLLS